MKLVVIFLAIYCGVGSTQSWDIRKCTQIVLSVIEESSGHLAGFADWQLRVMESVGEFERRRSACINVIRNNPPTWLDQTRFQACRTRELRDFIGLLGDFGTEFLKMGEGTVEMARKFIRDMALCAAR